MSILLSDTRITLQIDKMASDVREHVSEKLKWAELDESLDMITDSQLLALLCFVNQKRSHLFIYEKLPEFTTHW